jgi:hypothetical protein
MTKIKYSGSLRDVLDWYQLTVAIGLLDAAQGGVSELARR